MRYLNGKAVAPESALPVAVIEQDVSFFPHMTVKETLDFRVELKLGRKLNKSQRDDLVNELLQELNLVKAAHTIVGNNKVRGISGGERKRLSIACEMISSPSVIFLDEPTSGLDSYQALQVVETLRELANMGKTIVAVIHQPNQHSFAMFDDLLLLSEGKQMYFGEVHEVRNYMSTMGYAPPDEMGTAEHILECISRVEEGGGIEEQKSLARMDKLAEAANRVKIDLGIKKGEKHLQRFGSELRKSPRAGLLRQFRLLLNRSFREMLRGKGAIIIKIVQQVSLGLIYGGIYGLGTNQVRLRLKLEWCAKC
jgi:ABC-type multidrug transport system ATPase subunit